MGIRERVRRLVATKLNVDIEDVVPEASFVDDLGADSIDMVEMIMSVEEEFGVEIVCPERIYTVSDLTNYVCGGRVIFSGGENYFFSGRSIRAPVI
ncbi:MAG: acyl carrier protein [Candidatus Moranbacteria bacterium]|nr:acyl carrier protein [Candidatus Moranbacteria bacterium]